MFTWIFSTLPYFGILIVPTMSSTYILPATHQYISQQGSKGNLSQLYKEGGCSFKHQLIETNTKGGWGVIQGNLSRDHLHWEDCRRVSWFLPRSSSLSTSSSVCVGGLTVKTTSQECIKATCMDIWTYTMVLSRPGINTCPEWSDHAFKIWSPWPHWGGGLCHMWPHFSSTNNWGTINYVFGLLASQCYQQMFLILTHCLFQLIKPEMELTISFNIPEKILKNLKHSVTLRFGKWGDTS